MINTIIKIILFFTLIYPIVMSFFWIIGALLYRRRRNKEVKNMEDHTPRNEFTIIVPVYNEEKHIRELLLSNLRNTYKHIKIWVINDASTDGTKAVLDEIQNPRLKVTHLEENRGKAGVLNYALEHIDTEFFICADSDTLIYPNALFVLNNQINNEQDENIAAYAGSLTVDQEGIDSSTLRIQKLEYRSIITMIKRAQDYFFKNILTVSGAFVAYKTSIVKELGGFDEENSTEDIEITWRLTTNGYRAKFLDDFIAEVHSPSLARNLVSQRIRWNLGGLQTAKKYRSLLFKKGFWAHKSFLIERYVSALWIYSFIMTEAFIVSKLLFNFPEATTARTFVLPTLAILVTGLILQTVAYGIDKGCKEYGDEYLGLVLAYPIAYWFIQPIGYFGALWRYYFNHDSVAQWRNYKRKHLHLRKFLSALFDIGIFFLLYHITRVVLFEIAMYFPSESAVIYYFLVLFWMIIAILIFIYFVSPNYSTLGESIYGIRTYRKRSFIYNCTNMIVITVVVVSVFNISNTFTLIKIDDYDVLLTLIDDRLSTGGIIDPIFYIPFTVAIFERHLGIMEKLWRNDLQIT